MFDGIRYMYIRDGSYYCLTAVSMTDARQHLPNGTKIRKVKLHEDLAYFVDSADQSVRKAVFEGATTIYDLDHDCPGWRTKNYGRFLNIDSIEEDRALDKLLAAAYQQAKTAAQKRAVASHERIIRKSIADALRYRNKEDYKFEEWVEDSNIGREARGLTPFGCEMVKHLYSCWVAAKSI